MRQLTQPALLQELHRPPHASWLRGAVQLSQGRRQGSRVVQVGGVAQQYGLEVGGRRGVLLHAVRVVACSASGRRTVASACRIMPRACLPCWQRSTAKN